MIFPEDHHDRSRRLWIDDGSGEPELTDESIAVTYGDGSVQEAGVAWRAKGSVDLALLRLPAPAAAASYSRLRVLPSDSIAGPVDLYVPLDAGGYRRQAATLASDGTLSGVPPETPDAVIVRGGYAVGLWRRAEEDASAAAILFEAIPPSLRQGPDESRPGSRGARPAGG